MNGKTDWNTNGTATTQADRATRPMRRESNWKRQIKRNKWLYVLVLPGFLYFVIFKYLPMWGIVIAFQDYQPFLGIRESNWVGLENFTNFFSNPDFFRLLRNTLVLALYDLIFFFPAPIIIALLLNEIRVAFFKRTIQTLVYVPHFVSMVIIASITYVFLTPKAGCYTT